MINWILTSLWGAFLCGLASAAVLLPTLAWLDDKWVEWRNGR